MVVMKGWKWANKPEFVESYRVDPVRNSIEVETREGLTFAWLEEVAEMFGTKDINVTTETRNGGYCETCSYEYSVAILDVMNVKRWP